MTITIHSPHGPWARFEATEQDPWDIAKAAHLYRRAGLSANWSELNRSLEIGPHGSVDRLLKPPKQSNSFQTTADELWKRILDSGDISRLPRYWLYCLLRTADPLLERLALFWHDHFATNAHKVGIPLLMLRQRATITKHALGSFTELLSAMVQDPAMLIWLDGIDSRPEHPNENFAREFLELHTLGTPRISAFRNQFFRTGRTK